MRQNTVETIKNQPYLVLRLIRLTTRYQFKIETETEKQVDSDEVRQSFNEKAGIKNTRQNC